MLTGEWLFEAFISQLWLLFVSTHKLCVFDKDDDYNDGNDEDDDGDNDDDCFTFAHRRRKSQQNSWLE